MNRSPPPLPFSEDADLHKLWNALPEARVVGGAVRDWLAGHTVADIDMACPLPPETVARRLGATGIRTVPTGLEHGTITAVFDGRHFEITTLRRDIETDGRHAVVAFTDDWVEDAARRDFTINAMSLSRDGTIHDYFGGRADLAAGRVRFVGDAGTRIREDYLRILRFFRFHARYATGTPDMDAVASIRSLKDGLATLSAERVWQEIKRILAAPDPGQAVHLMEQTGVLGKILPEAEGLARFNRLLARNAPSDPLLRVSALIGAAAASVAERLKLSEAERERLATIAAAPDLPHDASDATLRRALADWPTWALTDRSWLNDEPTDRTKLRARLTAMERPVFPLRGRDALALGGTPGPAVGAALAATRTWWLAHDCLPDAGSCRAELARQLGNQPGR